MNAIYIAPASFVPSSYGRIFNIRHFSPLSYRLGLAMYCKGNVPSCIIALFFIGSPPTIFRRIITVIVYSVDGVVSGWSSSHVRKKGVKTISAKPPITNKNPSSSVVFKPVIVFSVASYFHSMINFIFNSISILFFKHFRKPNERHTTTRFCIPAAEASPPYGFSVSTLTLTQPSSGTCHASISLNDGEHSVFFARNINSSSNRSSFLFKTTTRHGKIPFEVVSIYHFFCSTVTHATAMLAEFFEYCPSAFFVHWIPTFEGMFKSMRHADIIRQVRLECQA